MRAPTPRQVEVLQALDAFRRREQIPPTLRELAEEIGVSGEQAVHTAYCHVTALEKRGLVSRRARASRSLVITAEGKRVLASAAARARRAAR